MAAKAGVNAVYAAGLIQGITLVTFPAASTIADEAATPTPAAAPIAA